MPPFYFTVLYIKMFFLKFSHNSFSNAPTGLLKAEFVGAVFHISFTKTKSVLCLTENLKKLQNVTY